MNDAIKVTTLFPEKLWEEVQDYKQSYNHLHNNSQTLLELVYKGLLYDKNIKQLDNQFTYGIAGLYYLLRQVAKERPEGDEFLEKVDNEFENIKNEVVEYIKDWGINYGSD